MRLIMIRHGESDHALRNVIAGRHSCRGLSERGFKQAELLARRFAVNHEVSDCQALLCSPVLRARQTVEVLAKVLPAGPIEQDCEIVAFPSLLSRRHSTVYCPLNAIDLVECHYTKR